MTKEIQFTQSGSGWEHSFSSTGAVAVQVNAKSAGRILVYASLDGLSRALVGEMANPYGNSFFGIDVPAGAMVYIWSSTEVTQARMQDV